MGGKHPPALVASCTLVYLNDSPFWNYIVSVDPCYSPVLFVFFYIVELQAKEEQRKNPQFLSKNLDLLLHNQQNVLAKRKKRKKIKKDQNRPYNQNISNPPCLNSQSKSSSAEPFEASCHKAGLIRGQYTTLQCIKFPFYHSNPFPIPSQNIPIKKNPETNTQSSTLREVPDHQELWLSPTTLSNLIIEINQRVPQDEALSTFATLNQQLTAAPGSGSAAPATTETVDQAAALHHLHDLCDEGDTMQVIKSPTRVDVQLASSSPTPSGVRAYRGIVSFTTPVRGGGGRIPASAEGSAAGVADAGMLGAQVDEVSNGLPQVSRLTCHFLIVRLEAQDTDLLVFFNVPHEEFDKTGDPNGLSVEEVLAEETIGALTGRLQICDWGLFV